MNSSTIIKSLESVTSKWTKQRKQELRGRAQSRSVLFVPKYNMSIKFAAARLMPQAYGKVSDNGRLPAQTRQLMYACRGEILKLTGRKELNSQYFSQVIVPEYIAAHPKQTAEWDVVYDARGHFAEPHTELITPLGTLDVRRYLNKIRAHEVDPLCLDDFFTAEVLRFPTYGPDNRFSAVLFIEKEGFMPLFAAAKLAERYDIAIMSTKGMPVVACRHLADVMCGKHDIPLLVLHDFDKAGFSIGGTLAGVLHYDQDYNERTPRYEYRHDFEVIDLGLRLPDVRAYKLESEVVQYRSDPTENLTANGATAEEIAFLCGKSFDRRPGNRVELNAFVSREFLTWIESKLKQHGIKKVVPDAETLQTAYRRALQIAIMRDHLDKIMETAKQQAQAAALPKGLEQLVRKQIKRDPSKPWDKVIEELAAQSCKNCEVGCTASKQAESAKTAKNLTTAPPPAIKQRGGHKRKDAVSLADLGISRELADRCQKMAETVREGDIEEYARSVQQMDDGEMTAEGLIAFCKTRRSSNGDSACLKEGAE